MLDYGLPRGAKLEHILKAVSEPVGKLLTVDLTFLEGDGPARIEVLCPALTDVDDLSLIFYFGKKGRRLTYAIDLAKLESRSGAPPRSPPQVPSDD